MSGTTTRAYSAAHKAYVQLLYKRYCKNAFDLGGNMLKWRYDVMDIRNRFEANRDVLNPRALAQLLAQAEDELRRIQHPAPYIPPNQPEGTAWDRDPPERTDWTIEASERGDLKPSGFWKKR